MFVSEFRYLVAFSHVSCSNLSDVENKAKFRTFWPPPPVKIMEGWAKSLGQLLKLYLRLNLRNTVDGRQLRGCWAPCFDKPQNVAIAMHIATRGRPTPRQSSSALSTTPMPSLKSLLRLPSYSDFTVEKLSYVVILTFDSVTLTFDLWPWTFTTFRDRMFKLLQNLSEIE